MQERSFYIHTFGCQMNVRDSSWLEMALASRGLQKAAMEDAQIYILNTCSVREKPERKVLDGIWRFQALAQKDKRRIIVVLGCVAQQLGKKLFEASPLVRLVAGTDGLVLAPDEILRLLENTARRECLTGFEKVYPEREKNAEKVENGSAFVNIMQGCDNFCSYCIVPFTRGRQKSRKIQEILAECEELLLAGASEIILLGQNVNAFGKDSGTDSFAGLLRKTASLPGLRRLRFVTPHPADMDDEVINLFGELKNLCPRLHLPLQAGSDRVLAKMRRRYDSAAFLELVEKLWKARPDIALSTDIIVGFPGESEADFQETLSMMRKCGFMTSFSFCYSDRPGTRASLMPDKIPAEVKEERLARLQALQDELGRQWLEQRKGEYEEILLEKPASRQTAEGDVWQGKDQYGATVCLPVSHAFSGMYCRAKIVEAKKHTLYGEAMEGGI